MLRRGLFTLGLLAALIVACKQENGAKPERLCTPGAYVFCRCANRAEATKLCKEDGASFEECAPCDGSGESAIGGGGTDGLGGGHGTDKSDENRSSTEGDGKITGTGTPLEADAGSAKADAGSGSTTTTSTPPPSTSDAGTGTSKSKDAGTSSADIPHCKPLENIAPRVELQMVADEPTAAVGGKPANGLYVQSWVVEFTGADGEAGPSKHFSRETLELAGDVGRYVFEDDDGSRASGGFRLTVTGSKVEVAYECPAAPPKEMEFDAKSSTLVIYDPPYARVFVKQKVSR